MSTIASLSDFKAALGITGSNTGSDTILARYLSASSDSIESSCMRTFGSSSYTGTFDGDDSRVLFLDEYPVLSCSSVSIDGTAVAHATGSTDAGWVLDKTAVVLRTGASPQTFTSGVLNVTVAYTAGYASIPMDVQQACIALASLGFNERTHIGTSAQGLGIATVSYLPSMMPKFVQDVIDRYRAWMI